MEEMETRVLLPSPAVDFNFDSTSNSPYVTAPSSPQPFGNYFFSAPASPTHSSAFFHAGGATSQSENPEADLDFKFDFRGKSGRPSVSAAELFDDGKIKPLKPPESPKSPKRKKEIDQFSAAFDQTRRVRPSVELETEKRGRERTQTSSNSINKYKSSRSLSPLRVSDMLSKQSSSVSTWYSKLKLKDLLLFRSKSEGSVRNEKDPLRKYSLLKKNENEDLKNSSFRSTESGSESTRRKTRVSAHELHYTVNRAISEEMKKKTYLPYKRGLLGCLGFNPPLGVHEISRGFRIN